MPRNPLKKVYGEWKPPRTDEVESYTYVTPSGKARVIYYPLLGEAKITSTYKHSELRTSWNLQDDYVTQLTPEDTIAVGIYLLGLQPHIRDVLARKEHAVSPEVLEQEDNTEESEQDM